MNLVGQLTFPGHGNISDIWGHVDATGNEYALVGTEDGTSIVDISIPSAPVEVFFSPGATTIWRDLKVWNDHVYITNDNGGGGMKIIDLSNLPGPITAGDVYVHTGTFYPFTIAHDVYIDENGYAYVMGADYAEGGAIILDLNPDPKIPVEVGLYDDYYLHDGMVRNDTLWGGAILDGFFTVIDVSNKAAPVTMQTQNTPSFFTHNCWISDDGKTLFTTDEKSNGYLASYDVSNLSNITELDRVQSSPGQLVIPHNTFVVGDYLVTSYYRDGVTIHDVSNPSNMVEVGNYDTSPAFSGDGFNGCWGVYPYLPSGLIIASDIENGLFILGPTYSPASFLEGNVTDSLTTFSLNGVQVDIVSTTASTTTNILGDYQTGFASAGTYNVTYSKFGYESKTVFGVVLTAGNTVTLNIELKPLLSFLLQGQVVETSTGNPIPNANVKVFTQGYSTTVITDAGGNFSIPNFYEGIYEVHIAKWAYNQLCLTNQSISVAANPYTYQMDNGYYDDFNFDLSWTENSTASYGIWVRGEPIGTTSGSDQVNPDFDVSNDCSDKAYVTGNAGGNSWDDDVDGGVVNLVSPTFDLSSYTNPYINYSRWFYNDGGTGSPNDSLIIKLSNGSSVSLIDFVDANDPANSTWVPISLRILDFMTLTNNMTLTVTSMDDSPGHLVEAGFDRFEIVEMGASGVQDNSHDPQISIFPNPFNDDLTINYNQMIESGRVEIYEVTGRLVEQLDFNNKSVLQFKNDYKRGVYFINVYNGKELIKTEKVVKF